MSSTEAHPPQSKGISTVSKVFWMLLLLLALAVAGFVYSAWQQLNRIEPVAAPQTPGVEVWTPAGANSNTPVYTPQPGQSASAPANAAPPPTATPATPPAATPAAPPPIAAAPQETPVLPTNPPVAAKPAPKKPAANTNNPLDNLF